MDFDDGVPETGLDDDALAKWVDGVDDEGPEIGLAADGADGGFEAVEEVVWLFAFCAAAFSDLKDIFCSIL